MTDVKEVAFDALREMYEEAEPSVDFDEIRENAEDYPDDWYTNYYLHPERQREIVDKHCEKHNLTNAEHTTVTMTAILHYGPASTKNA
jgi:hypothetical protein